MSAIRVLLKDGEFRLPEGVPESGQASSPIRQRDLLRLQLRTPRSDIDAAGMAVIARGSLGAIECGQRHPKRTYGGTYPDDLHHRDCGPGAAGTE